MSVFFGLFICFFFVFRSTSTEQISDNKIYFCKCICYSSTVLLQSVIIVPKYFLIHSPTLCNGCLYPFSSPLLPSPPSSPRSPRHQRLKDTLQNNKTYSLDHEGKLFTSQVPIHLLTLAANSSHAPQGSHRVFSSLIEGCY